MTPLFLLWVGLKPDRSQGDLGSSRSLTWAIGSHQAETLGSNTAPRGPQAKTPAEQLTGVLTAVVNILGRAVQTFTLSPYFSSLKPLYFSWTLLIFLLFFFIVQLAIVISFQLFLWHGDLLKAAVLFLCSFLHSQQMSSLFKIFNSLMINQVISPTKIYNFMLWGLKMALSARKKSKTTLCAH